MADNNKRKKEKEPDSGSDDDDDKKEKSNKKKKREDEDGDEEDGSGDVANLHPRVLDLLTLLYDHDILKKMAAQANFDIDEIKEKDGKWKSKSLQTRIEDAELELRDIEEHLADENATGNDFAEVLLCSYNFYKLLPPLAHAVPPCISSSELIQEKRQVVRVLKMISELVSKKRVGAQYKSLGCQLTPLAEASDAYQMVAKYVGTTNHPKVSCQIEDVFAVEQQNEELGSEVEKSNQKKLLWHGAILPFIPKILREGFQLPPATSSRFPAGQAIYFSDVFTESLEKSKSFSIDECPTACLFLAEVSLDNLQTIKQREPARAGPDPTLCLGRSYGDPNQRSSTPSGAVVPNGPIVANGIAGTDFEYNKYAIFNPKQAKVKYLVRIKLTGASAPERAALPKHLPFGAPAAKGIWMYESGKNNWKRYTPELSQLLEDNFRNGKKFFHINIANVAYSINLDHMCQFQTNQQKKSRKIKRV
eukprot:TRINITY_DN16591_c0_g1_i1.p1 TRINITY_DN16591_c0_g1~~TRINITY_DN16591_c0_g1_i1.p1  ORF type:complete len:476 (-),score=158.61 TRINITY_DN16591_c0_g1_i1:36-1463(-)